MTHYNGINAVKSALEKAGTIDKEALVDALKGLTIDTPTGSMSIGADDHHTTMQMYLAKTEGQNLKVVQTLGRIAPQALCS